MEAIRLERPLIMLDVETTGVHPQVDRIVQLGLVKLYPEGEDTEWQTLVDPGMPIPPEATECHGITDSIIKAAQAPLFSAIAPVVAKGLSGCDVGGYNIKFDLLFIRTELERYRRGWGDRALEGTRVIDPFRIFCQRQPRSLSDAVEYYCGEKLEGAHDALIDARAALHVFLGQLERYPDLPRSVEELHKVYFETPAEGHLDPEGKLAWRYGEATINFGKWATVPLRKVEQGYLQWMLNNEFSTGVKRIIREALKGNYPRREE